MKWVLLIVSLLFMAPSSWAAKETIGTTARTEGNAINIRGITTLNMMKNDQIEFDDRLITGQKSRLKIDFIDGTELFLGDDSDLIIDDFVYSPNEKNLGVMTLTEGTFRLVTGQINKARNSLFVLKTPLATIGIRGTDFWGQQSETQLKIILLDDGELDISTRTDDVTLNTPLEGLVIDGTGTAAPISLNPTEVEDALQSVQ